MRAHMLLQSFLLSGAVAVQNIVNLHYSLYRGEAIDNGVSQWLGMRFAAPPLGDLRFSPPVDPHATYGIQDATQVRNHKQYMDGYIFANACDRYR